MWLLYPLTIFIAKAYIDYFLCPRLLWRPFHDEISLYLAFLACAFLLEDVDPPSANPPVIFRISSRGALFLSRLWRGLSLGFPCIVFLCFGPSLLWDLWAHSYPYSSTALRWGVLGDRPSSPFSALPLSFVWVVTVFCSVPFYGVLGTEVAGSSAMLILVAIPSCMSLIPYLHIQAQMCHPWVLTLGACAPILSSFVLVLPLLLLLLTTLAAWCFFVFLLRLFQFRFSWNGQDP